MRTPHAIQGRTHPPLPTSIHRPIRNAPWRQRLCFTARALAVALLSGILAASADPTPDAGPWRLYSTLRTLQYGGPQPLHQLFNELEGPQAPNGKDRMLSLAHLEVGVANTSWSLGFFFRHDYMARFSPDTIELLYRDKNDLPVRTDATYDLWIDVHHLEAQGLRIQFPRLVAGPLEFAVGLSLFHATGLLDGSGRGTIETGASSYVGSARLNYRYDQDLLLDRKVDPPEGWGAGFDLSLSWRPRPGTLWTMDVRDLGARIRWRDAPYTRALVTSSTLTFDENGFIETSPLLSGVESNKDATQHLPIQLRTTIRQRLTTGWTALAAFEQYDDVRLPSLGIQTNRGNWTGWAGWQWETNAVELGWGRGHTRLRLLIDQLDPDRITTAGLEFSFRPGSL